jgi:hypothetical protein
MKKLLWAVAALAAGLSCGSAFAQSTYAELEGKGIKGLTGDEVKQALSGAKLKGQTAQGVWYEMSFANGGGLSGWVESVQGRANFVGNWTVNEKHQYCWDYTVNMVNTKVNGCRRMFKIGDDYYVAVSGQGKQAMMGKLEITK